MTASPTFKGQIGVLKEYWEASDLSNNCADIERIGGGNSGREEESYSDALDGENSL